ncbi:unnamed protein product [[Candida] boidinii]|uniref:Unnamed protein product n=1 Tax=Candida boidinii TaxID=5477 RepID=A0ACB5U3B7_CANBO|nr:unnamed protein product [[Candida] boidinii]
MGPISSILGDTTTDSTENLASGSQGIDLPESLKDSLKSMVAASVSASNLGSSSGAFATATLPQVNDLTSMVKKRKGPKNRLGPGKKSKK